MSCSKRSITTDSVLSVVITVGVYYCYISFDFCNWITIDLNNCSLCCISERHKILDELVLQLIIYKLFEFSFSMLFQIF